MFLSMYQLISLYLDKSISYYVKSIMINYLISGLQESSLDEGVFGLKQTHDCSACSHAVTFYQAYAYGGYDSRKITIYELFG